MTIPPYTTPEASDAVLDITEKRQAPAVHTLRCRTLLRGGFAFRDTMEQELRDKISRTTKKAMKNPVVIEKMRQAKLRNPPNRKGYKCTAEQIERMSKSHIGQKVWNKGLKGCYKQSAETIEKRVSQLRGANNPAWKGGVASENANVRSSMEYDAWRTAVFTRDDWTCKKCKTKGSRLHAHHICNFAQWIELRFVIENGITFCKECHDRFHSRFGIKNNNEKQIQEFLAISKDKK